MGIYVGLMSGTSLDGIDVAVVRFEGEEGRPAATETLAFGTTEHDAGFRGRLRSAIEAGGAGDLCALDFELGRRFARATLETLEGAGVDRGDVRAIGSHGQTVWHEPPRADAPGATLQLGQPAVIAEETGIPVVSDFRARDVAAGGHGAPLTAYTDFLLLSDEGTSRAIQNLGGMGNVTALPASRAASVPIAFDTGPGVALLDAAVERWTDGRMRFDEGGELAAAGAVSLPALEEWLDDPFFDEPPPRSTGRERFGEARLRAWMARHGDLPGPDLVATLAELTARSVADAYRWIDFPLDEVVLCGGGARNPELRRRIAELLRPVPVLGLEDLGWDPDAREAVAFALLARLHELGLPANAPWATGAAGPRRLGVRAPA